MKQTHPSYSIKAMFTCPESCLNQAKRDIPLKMATSGNGPSETEIDVPEVKLFAVLLPASGSFLVPGLEFIFALL